MRVFVTGATGFIGSAVVQELLGAGHQVLGLARSDASATSLTRMGAEVQRGSLDDLDSLRSGVAATDGVIHLAFVHDFSDYVNSVGKDLRAVQTIGAALAGSNRPLVNTSGVLLLAPGQLATENDGLAEDARSPRRASEIAGTSVEGVRGSVIRLAPTVHGAGDGGFVPMLIELARKKGFAAYIGDGAQRWPAVHRLDAARLYRLALEKGEAGSRFHGVAEEGVAFRDIAQTIGEGLGIPVRSLTPDEAPSYFEWMAMFAAADGPTSSALTRETLGWTPEGPTLLQDMRENGYFSDASSSDVH